ncbi:MAG: non-canonical purine NTP pyrophosphatase [Acidobacteriota bacterium]
MPPIAFVTSRVEKAEEARRMGFSIDCVSLDLPEPQALDPRDIVDAKARAAFGHLSRPVLVEDSALSIRAWGGFPGALVKWLERGAGVAAIPRMLASWDDREAVACCVVAFFDGDRIVTGRGECTGRIASSPRGGSGFGWDTIFEPEGSALTFAEMGAGRKDLVSHRRRAWEDLAARLPAGLK